jgi:hypothetical protein
MRAALNILAVMLLAALASAQVPTSGNLFFGYSFQNASASAFSLSGVSRPDMNGWRASLEGKIFPWVGMVADFTGQYGSQSFTAATPGGLVRVSATGHEHDVLFGPRVSVPAGRLRPFAEFMVGVSRITTGGSAYAPGSGPSNTSFATAFGGGLDYRLARPVAWRFQGDYVQTRFFGTTQSNVRLSTGIVLRF